MRTAAQKIRLTVATMHRSATQSEYEHYRIRLARQLRALRLTDPDKLESMPMPKLSGALLVYYGAR